MLTGFLFYTTSAGLRTAAFLTFLCSNARAPTHPSTHTHTNPHTRTHTHTPQIGLSFEAVRMAVLVQRVVPAHYAFVIHTRNPSNNDPEEIFCELVRGLGAL